MSYCRWSDEAFTSDVYCYEDTTGGWTTHVANSRLSERGTLEGVMPRAIPIGLPCDGRSFNDPSLEAFRERLVQLREAGYRVPDYVLERIGNEIVARDAAIVHALR